MSARVEIRALRVPADLLGIGDVWEYCESHEDEEEFDYGNAPDFHYPHFEPGLVAERDYLDYVLSEKVVPPGPDIVLFHRELTPKEKEKYLPVFLSRFPGLDPAAVHYVRYRYYDGGDAPDVYE